jgi:uncharacterized protein (DUF427 family)
MFTESSVDGLRGTIRFDWAALDAWFEEDEQVFVHPRNPYVRVDALRSTRHARVAIDGAVLAESASPVMVFETGLPTRYYFNRTQVNFDHLVPTDTVTACPCKGTTTGYWSVHVGETINRDLAWTYDFPTPEVSPIAGPISLYNERVDMSSTVRNWNCRRHLSSRLPTEPGNSARTSKIAEYSRVIPSNGRGVDIGFEVICVGRRCSRRAEPLSERESVGSRESIESQPAIVMGSVNRMAPRRRWTELEPAATLEAPPDAQEDESSSARVTPRDLPAYRRTWQRPALF